jgi:Concanavalin A-like lectin/glucanases superfamily
MAISAACPKCGHAFKLAHDLAGKKIRCTECKAVFLVPARDEDESMAERPRSRTSSAAASSRSDRADTKETTTRRKREETDEGKRRPPRAARRKGVPLWAVGVGVVFLLVLIGGGIFGGIWLFRDPGKDSSKAGNVAQLPTPLVEWSDKEAEGVPVAGARGLQVIVKGKLVKVVPLTQPIREKSLEVWCTLANLDQRQTTLMELDDGVETWDGIVFADQNVREWYPGSSYRHRSGKLDGPVESAQPTDLVHLVMVYDSFGLIMLFRNGQLHSTYRPPTGPNSSLRAYPAEGSRLGIGADSAGQLSFQGGVKLARLYDHALAATEITALFNDGKRRLAGPSGGPDLQKPGGPVVGNNPGVAEPKVKSLLIGKWTWQGSDPIVSQTLEFAQDGTFIKKDIFNKTGEVTNRVTGTYKVTSETTLEFEFRIFGNSGKIEQEKDEIKLTGDELVISGNGHSQTWKRAQ